jgi:hypothetical protein
MASAISSLCLALTAPSAMLACASWAKPCMAALCELQKRLEGSVDVADQALVGKTAHENAPSG